MAGQLIGTDSSTGNAPLIGQLTIDSDAVLGFCQLGAAIGANAPAAIRAPPSALAIPAPAALFGRWFFLLVEVFRSIADSHGQLLAI